MINGGLSAIFQTIAAASVPAKVAVVAVAGAGAVVAGVPAVVTITNAAAEEAPATTQVLEPGDDVVVTTVSPTSVPETAPVTSTTQAATETSTTTTTEAIPPERLQLWCDRVEEGDRLVVVCEWTAAVREDVTAYVVLRNGERVAVLETSGRDGVDNPAGMRWVDYEAPARSTLYAVHVIDADGSVIGASNSVIVGVEATTTTTTEAPPPTTEKQPESDRTTTVPKEEEQEEEEPNWEPIGLWCGRSGNGSEPGVVCEFAVSERENFGAYVLKRDGHIIWEYGQRTMPGRPWPDIRYVDSAAPAGAVTYAAYIVDINGNWVGGSGSLTLPSSVPMDDHPAEDEPAEEEPVDEEPAWESLNMGCARGEGSTVVCEYSASERDGFAFYVLKRDGAPIAEIDGRNSQHITDHEAPSGEVSYTVYVLDAENNWTGSSNTVTLPAIG